MLQNILDSYGLSSGTTEIVPFGNGLINQTWAVNSGQERFILQRINHTIFKNPCAIAANISMLDDYLFQHNPDYLFVAAEKTLDEEPIVCISKEDYFRLFRFIKGSHAIDVVKTPLQAYEAARQFGRFTHLLAGFPAENLHVTLPQFHDLSLRQNQFKEAIKNGNDQRIAESLEMIIYLKKQQGIADVYKNICGNPGFKKRVTHHDTKISNVLFDENDQGLCVIDLDTVMPGYFISDVGDMMRTYLSPVSEEEQDFSKIAIRDDYFKAIADGYLFEMKEELTSIEKEHFIYAGKFMIYMQALRFLTDYLNNDVYYGASYGKHNFVRAGNQITLLQKLIDKENILASLISL